MSNMVNPKKLFVAMKLLPTSEFKIKMNKQTAGKVLLACNARYTP
jgi:hypothetical protein